jgi:hypothetical protein
MSVWCYTVLFCYILEYTGILAIVASPPTVMTPPPPGPPAPYPICTLQNTPPPPPQTLPTLILVRLYHLVVVLS